MILYIKVLNKQQNKYESELHVQCSYPLLTLARTSAATGYFSWSVGRSVSRSVGRSVGRFIRTFSLEPWLW